MPEWVVILETVLLSISLILMSWTWIQAYRNWRAVDGTSLEEFAGKKLLRLSALWIAVAAGSTVGIVSVWVRRSPETRLVISVGLILLVAGLVVTAYHEYAEMKRELQDNYEGSTDASI